MPCVDCDAYDSCPFARLELRKWANGEARATSLLRSYIREAHELRQRIATLEAALQRQVDNVERWMETGVPADAAESRSIYEQMVCALRRKLPRRPDCLRSMDIKE